MSHFNDRNEAESLLAHVPDLAPEDVRSFLLANPDFIAGDVELVAALTGAPQEGGGNVVDMQHYVISRLQRQVRTLREIQSDLIEASSLNSLAREQVQVVALAMLDARSLDELLEYITAPLGLAQALGIGAAALCIEAENGVPGIGEHGLRMLEPGGVARIMGGNMESRLVANVRGSRSLYGAWADEVMSEALVRLEFSRVSPPGLLALGGTLPEQFHPDQAADLLEFLARITERSLRRWLDLPA